MEKTIALLDEAIALDSTFGMAWRALAIADFDRRKQAATKAFELRDRLTERERYHATAIYQSYVLVDNDATVTTYRALLEEYPDDATALNNLGVAYRDLGQLELAAEMYGRAVEVEPSSAHYYGNLIGLLYDIGAVDSSRIVLDRFAERFPDHPNVIRFRSEFAYADGDVAAAEAELAPMLASEVMSLRRQANRQISSFRVRAGRLREGQQIWRESQEELSPLDEAMFRGRLEMQVVFDTAAATARILEALATAPDSVVDDRAGGLSYFFYAIGDVERGDEFYERNLVVDSVRIANRPERFRPLQELGHDANRALAIGDYETVLGNEKEMEQIWLRLSTGQDPANWALGAVPAFEALGQTDSVVVRYETWLGRRDLGGFWGDSRNLPRAYERLAQLYDEKGDLEQAAGYYALFVELWADADPELQPRVAAARARMEAIVRERG
jgi:tetratricopeptide (TPR) repeat protein